MNKNQVEEAVVAELRARKVKLWLAPFWCCDDKSTTQEPNQKALQELAESLNSSLVDLNEQEIMEALLSLQVHALEKLQKKQEEQHSVSYLEIKVFGLVGNISGEHIDENTKAFTKTWAQQVEFLPKSLKLHDVNPKLTIGTFIRDLGVALNASSLRLTHKGRPIASPNETLASTLLHACKIPKTGGLKTTMLCQVTYQEQDQATPTPAPTVQQSPEQALIDSIRQAAAKLGTMADVDVTDQNGNHVPMLAADRLSFLTALGLARLGRKYLHDHKYKSALVFLLQADEEWNTVNAIWRDRVDNYGILQLDICWTFLKLEDSSSLADATRRLQVAETVLLKQVDSNFCTLALAMADMGKQVPPLAAVFCRLYLLQGIALRYSDVNSRVAKEKLDWCYQVCNALRSSSPPSVVSSLVDAMNGNITASQAICALRRADGNPDQAMNLLEEQLADNRKQEDIREKQHKLGLCQDTMSFVNINLVAKLQGMLGIPSPTSVAASLGGNGGTQEQDAIQYQVAVGLMRLANNDISKAIDIYQEVERSSEAVLQCVAELDQSLARQGLETPASFNASRKRSHDNVAVDSVALATLVSMGVEEPLAKRALRASENNVDVSLVWLTRKDDEVSARQRDGPENDPSSGGIAMEEDGVSRNDEQEEEMEDFDQEQLELEEAMDLLRRELGGAFQDSDLEKEYLGSTLDEEWEYLEKYVGSGKGGDGNSK